MRLFVSLSVHEIEIVAILVEELHGDFIHVDSFNCVAGAEAVLKHGAGADVPQLGLDEGPQVPWGAVLDTEDQVQVVVVLNDHARTHLGCWNSHGLKSSP